MISFMNFCHCFLFILPIENSFYDNYFEMQKTWLEHDLFFDYYFDLLLDLITILNQKEINSG